LVGLGSTCTVGPIGGEAQDCRIISDDRMISGFILVFIMIPFRLQDQMQRDVKPKSTDARAFPIPPGWAVGRPLAHWGEGIDRSHGPALPLADRVDRTPPVLDASSEVIPAAPKNVCSFGMRTFLGRVIRFGPFSAHIVDARARFEKRRRDP
jgi:hypothetical protein